MLGGASLSSTPIFQPFFHSDRVIAALVTAGEQQGDGLAAQRIEQHANCRLRGRLFEFG